MSGFDALPTPQIVAQQAMSFIHSTLEYECGYLLIRNILDPGAGWGVWGREARTLYPYAEITGIDIQERILHPHHITHGYNIWLRGNYLNYGNSERYSLIIGNPPYSIAQAFIEKSLSLLAPNGYLAQFLRLGFVGSQKRIPFFRDNPPCHIRVFSHRPSFTGNGKTDRGQEYALFIWKQGWNSQTEFSWEFGQNR